jgi:lipoprotein-anchoring transpeptidase ErfK/SrfK
MRASGKIQKFQIAIDGNRLRLLKDHWLPVAAFVALSLPLTVVQTVPTVPTVNPNVTSSTVVSTTAISAIPIPQPAPASKPAPLPQTAAKKVEHRNPHRILISIPDRKLALLEDGKVQKIYQVAVGADVTPSPTGEFHIAHKIVGPTYSHHGKVVAAGKGNPLGSRWMGLDKEHYGIHGTNMPQSIGHAASHGCIRMGKHDVEELFQLAGVGDVVEIHGERTEEMAQIFGGLQPEQPVEVAQNQEPDAGGGR